MSEGGPDVLFREACDLEQFMFRWTVADYIGAILAASWNEGPAKAAMLDFVHTITDRSSNNFVLRRGMTTAVAATAFAPLSSTSAIIGAIVADQLA